MKIETLLLRIEMLDVTGRFVLSKELNSSNKIEVASLELGMCLVHITNLETGVVEDTPQLKE